MKFNGFQERDFEQGKNNFKDVEVEQVARTCLKLQQMEKRMKKKRGKERGNRQKRGGDLFAMKKKAYLTRMNNMTKITQISAHFSHLNQRFFSPFLYRI